MVESGTGLQIDCLKHGAAVGRGLLQAHQVEVDPLRCGS
jgi:hypothetical protein